MTIVDSSSWIEALRDRGNPVVRERVARLLDAGEAAWCPIIQMELWRGVRDRLERETLEFLESRITMLSITQPVWDESLVLLKKATASGLTAPVTDVLIVATAKFHNAALEHCDRHLKALLDIT